MAPRLHAFFPDPVFKAPNPFRQNPLLKAYIGIFIFFWVFTGATATDFVNWVLENSLTVSAVVLLIYFYRKFPFSNVSYSLILIFLLLHLYGSQNAYAKNPFGFWLQEQFHFSRNHYDRIVHFCFGFLLAYPMQEVLCRLFGVRSWLAYFFPVEYTLSLSAFYEIVEWLVADVFFPKAGAAFIGAQGDFWDSQKDVFMALLGAIITMLLVLTWRKVTFRSGKR
ncbi:DUF2238 domain-containing protein [Adhaeribacter soli]|uniref:DUF2238 domain-containing protein n=1 Tax=Adhaeribacter soli TaxID=2607655 RepID=A0A5N1ISC6_9BACT|nr:DUF2238 domain-containing protein [Adhaeribacter soli]KAA9331256.1 DUF2238 domain-containing protein [Adhaeribacter soli]